MNYLSALGGKDHHKVTYKNRDNVKVRIGVEMTSDYQQR